MLEEEFFPMKSLSCSHFAVWDLDVNETTGLEASSGASKYRNGILNMLQHLVERDYIVALQILELAKITLYCFDTNNLTRVGDGSRIRIDGCAVPSNLPHQVEEHA